MGIAQGDALARAMGTFTLERVLSSPLSRCVRTAVPSAARFSLEVEEEPLLLEISHGVWEGRLRDELAQNDAVRYRQWREEPAIVEFEGGETVAAVLDRWRAFVAAFEPQGDTLIVTHDAVVRVALVDRLQRELSTFWDVRVLNGAYAWFTVENNRWTLQDECVSDHLAGIVADPSTQAL